MGHDWGWGAWLVMSVMMVGFWGLVIAGIVVLVRYLTGGRQGGGPAADGQQRSAEELLAERWAGVPWDPPRPPALAGTVVDVTLADMGAMMGGPMMSGGWRGMSMAWVFATACRTGSTTKLNTSAATIAAIARRLGRFQRRADAPVLRQADPPPATTVPWWATRPALRGRLNPCAEPVAWNPR